MRTVFDYFTPSDGVPYTRARTIKEDPKEVSGGAEFAQDERFVPKSWFADPNSIINSLGLGFHDHPTPLGFATLEQMARNHVITAAIIQLRMHQAASFCVPQRNKYSIGFRIAHRDPERNLTEGERHFARRMEDFMQRGGEVESEGGDLPTQVKRMVRDRYTFDQIGVEIVQTMGGTPHRFVSVPASTLRLAAPKYKRNTPLEGDELDEDIRYVQLINNRIVQTYTPRDLAFSVANPRTDLLGYSYGYSEQELLIRTVTRHLWAEEWNTNAFSQGSTTKGILNVKGNMTQRHFEQFRAQWLAQISGVTNAWRTPLINSRDDLQWINLQPTNQEMGYAQWMEYLTKLSCAMFLVDPAELNFDVRAASGQAPMFMSNNESQQKMSQDRGLRPLLSQIQGIFSHNIIQRFDPNWRFEFVGLDAKTEQQAIELRLKELGAYKTINEVRASEQLEAVPFGDIIPSGAYIGFRNQKEMLAMQQGPAGGGPSPGEGSPRPGSDEAKLGQHIKDQVRDSGSSSSPRRLPDRFLNPNLREDWEETYNASLTAPDALMKALAPLQSLLGDGDADDS
jgi:Phage portal protein